MPGKTKAQARLLLEALQRLGTKNVILLSPCKGNKNVSKQPPDKAAAALAAALLALAQGPSRPTI